MDFSILLYPYDRWEGLDSMLIAMRRADELGFSGVSLPEHLMNPVDEAGHPMLPTDMWHDPFILGATIAAVTQNLQLHVNAMVVPYRHPLHAARVAASLDQLSAGRVKMTVASGWMKEEFAALGLNYRQRGAMTDEYLAAMRVLWTEEEPEFHGRYVDISRCRVSPKCVQTPHVPLWGGGGVKPGGGLLPPVLERVLKYCQGWGPMAAPAKELQPGVDWIRTHAPDYGVDADSLSFRADVHALGGEQVVAAGSRAHHPTGLKLHAGPPLTLNEGRDDLLRQLETYQAVGFNEFRVYFPWRTGEEYVERLEWLATDIMPQVA